MDIFLSTKGLDAGLDNALLITDSYALDHSAPREPLRLELLLPYHCEVNPVSINTTPAPGQPIGRTYAALAKALSTRSAFTATVTAHVDDATQAFWRVTLSDLRVLGLSLMPQAGGDLVPRMKVTLTGAKAFYEYVRFTNTGAVAGRVTGSTGG